jgi:dynein light chain LC8-type
MYTSTYSPSSPVRTSTFGVGSANYQHQPSNRINYNSYQNMDDGNASVRRSNTAYLNSPSSLTSIPVQTGTPSRKPTTNYNVSSTDFNPTKYSTTSYRSYAGDNDVFRSPSSAGNFRARSYDDLVNDQNQSYHSQSSIYNPSSSRTGLNNNNTNPYGQQQQHQAHIRRDDTDGDLIVKSTDLSATNEQQMLELVQVAFRKYDLSNQRELAGFLKRSADKAFSSCWHCIVGRQFSSYVTHEMNGFIYLTKGPLSILLFKSGS